MIKGAPKKPVLEKQETSAEIEKKPPVLIAPYDTCRYHRTLEPKIFKTGEIIPEGWEDTPDKFKE